ncbi:MAG: hypothetical protein AB2A00_28340 [Myxococcota bacterium]
MELTFSDVFELALGVAFFANLLVVARLYHGLKVTNARITILSNLVKAQRREEMRHAAPEPAPAVEASSPGVKEVPSTHASVPVAITRVPAPDTVALLRKYEEQDQQLQVQLRRDFTYRSNRADTDLVEFVSDGMHKDKPGR